jgi:hypothetical protein
MKIIELNYGDICPFKKIIVKYSNCSECNLRSNLKIRNNNEETMVVKCYQLFDSFLGEEESKSSLGLKPRVVVEQARIGEIRMAMNRYIDEFKTIPLEWIFEYNDLAHRQKKDK